LNDAARRHTRRAKRNGPDTGGVPVQGWVETLFAIGNVTP